MTTGQNTDEDDAIDVPRLPCGCDYVSKYCDAYHWEIRAKANRAQAEREIREQVAREIEANLIVAANHWLSDSFNNGVRLSARVARGDV